MTQLLSLGYPFHSRDVSAVTLEATFAVVFM